MDYDYFNQWAKFGYSVIPIRLDGSKAAAVSWKAYQDQRATADELKRWFNQRAGIGIICGVISGGLEVLDFDDPDPYPKWYRGVSDIVDRLPVIETGGGGYHVLYRCEVISGGQKIATDRTRSKPTLIESRGQGNYIIGVGSPLSVHRSGQPYVQVSGPLAPDLIPIITPDERRRLWAAARAFDHDDTLSAYRPKPVTRRPSRTGSGPNIFSEYDREGHLPHLLVADGWTTTNGELWTRPGKAGGTSARLTTNQAGDPVLIVFSSSVAGVTGSYTRFSASQYLAAVRFAGDWRAVRQFIIKGD